MSLDHALPSFAQAFSASSLDRISSATNALPPIHIRTRSSEPRRVKSPGPAAPSRPNSDEEPPSRTAGRKRAHTEISSSHNDRQDSHEPQPRIKEEPEQDMLDPSPLLSSKTADFRNTITDTSGAPPPSSVHPLKKRRVTISGAAHPGPLDTDVRTPPDPSNSTPISPVVIGFTVQRDNPSAIEQVRSMITVKQKQKALIEQRRGSITGPPPVDAPTPKSTPPARSVRRSPNAGTSSKRGTNSYPAQPRVSPRPPSPTPVMVPSQAPPQSSSHSLPPPPISFARRRASQLGSGKRKPADILISPREEQTQEQFAPSIQSAPPIPHHGQGAFYSGRFPMKLPRLPSIMAPGGEPTRRIIGGTVPPTPTRLASMRNSNQISQPIPGIANRSPPTASVAISSMLVPPTPNSLQHPGYSGDKSAFLAPFEVFYDALNDSKQLKNWLGEQLQRSNALMQSLTQQQEKLHEIVDGLVEKKVSGMRHEMLGLHRRIEELEDALRSTSAVNGRRLSADAGPGKVKGKQPLRNGIASSQMAQDSYTFPPASADRDRLRADVERPERPISSPNLGRRDGRESQGPSENDMDTTFESRRLSISASRLDPPRPQRQASEDSKGSFNSPPGSFAHAPVKLVRVGSHHQSPRTPGLPPPASPPRREEQRNSVGMSPPDVPAASQ
ncbi:hypothetical protein C8J56DRAFT_911785 [Mycena floridula]|nr:hypothetical protein C8J56DRAFT_911785 [Mycena floridula]